MENMNAIRNKCRRAKKELGYSNQYIATQADTSKATVERFLSEDDSLSFRYDNVNRIVGFLIGFDEPTPEPEKMSDKFPLKTNEMIDWYKEIINIRAAETEKLKEEIAELKSEHKKEIADLKTEYHSDLIAKQKTNKNLSIILAAALLAIVLLVVIDLSFTGIGWIRA